MRPGIIIPSGRCRFAAAAAAADDEADAPSTLSMMTIFYRAAFLIVNIPLIEALFFSLIFIDGDPGGGKQLVHEQWGGCSRI